MKQPHFFNSDDSQAVRALDQNESLLCKASEENIGVGKASVWCLLSAKLCGIRTLGLSRWQTIKES
jgi:hypothetical protein